MAALGSNMKGKVNKPSGLVKEIKKTRTKTTSKATTKAKTKKEEPKITAKSTNPAAIKQKKVAAKSSKVTQTTKAVTKPTKPTTKEKRSASKKITQKASQAQKVTKQKTAPKAKSTPKQTEKELLTLRNAQLILEPSKRKTIRKTKVYLEGELTINNVDAFTQLIHPIFKDYDYVDFNLRSITTLDLCFIQMLYHFQQSYATRKKTVKVDSDMATEMKKIVINAGFEELMFIPKLV